MPFTLDPELGAVLYSMTGGKVMPTGAIGDIQHRRNSVAGFAEFINSVQPKTDDVDSKDYYTPAKDGHQILMRWYTKKGSDTSTSTPAVLYIHGGGFISMDIDAFKMIVPRYVSNTGVPFLMVEFRYVPEHPPTTLVTDCYTALQWLHSHAQELGVDHSRIAVMGDSGGGGIAACLTHHIRAEGGPPLAKQILIYPMLDDRHTAPDEHLLPFSSWTYEDNATGWGALLGDKMGKEGVPATLAAARMTDATGLPPLYIDVGELDMFRDENIEYARKFGQAGISAELHVYPGAIHGFEACAPAIGIAKRAMENRYKAILSIPSPSPAKL